MPLSHNEAQQMAILYESPAWKTFRKVFLEEEQLILAQLCVTAPNWDQVVENRGAIKRLRDIEVEMHKNYKKVNKDGKA